MVHPKGPQLLPAQYVSEMQVLVVRKEGYKGGKEEVEKRLKVIRAQD